MEQKIIRALQKESDKLTTLIEELEEKNCRIPDHLLDQAVVVASIIVMVKTDGLLDTVLALASTYPLPIFEQFFVVMEQDKVTLK